MQKGEYRKDKREAEVRETRGKEIEPTRRWAGEAHIQRRIEHLEPPLCRLRFSTLHHIASNSRRVRLKKVHAQIRCKIKRSFVAIEKCKRTLDQNMTTKVQHMIT